AVVVRDDEAEVRREDDLLRFVDRENDLVRLRKRAVGARRAGHDDTRQQDDDGNDEPDRDLTAAGRRSACNSGRARRHFMRHYHPAQAPRMKIAFETFVLPNGLTVILHVDRGSPLVAVNLWYHVGSKDEAPGRTGFAHLFEHLMFMGSLHAPYPSFDAIMEAWGGHNNGTTSNDRTNYYEIGPRNLLETFLWLEADRLATLAEVITAEELERQRKVVLNERRQSYENRPYGRGELRIPEIMYADAHPYHWPTIGSQADLEAASVDDVRSFFERFYRPSHASLTIAGDFHPAPAPRLVDQDF